MDRGGNPILTLLCCALVALLVLVLLSWRVDTPAPGAPAEPAGPATAAPDGEALALIDRLHDRLQSLSDENRQLRAERQILADETDNANREVERQKAFRDREEQARTRSESALLEQLEANRGLRDRVATLEGHVSALEAACALLEQEWVPDPAVAAPPTAPSQAPPEDERLLTLLGTTNAGIEALELELILCGQDLARLPEAAGLPALDMDAETVTGLLTLGRALARELRPLLGRLNTQGAQTSALNREHEAAMARANSRIAELERALQQLEATIERLELQLAAVADEEAAIDRLGLLAELRSLPGGSRCRQARQIARHYLDPVAFDTLLADLRDGSCQSPTECLTQLWDTWGPAADDAIWSLLDGPLADHVLATAIGLDQTLPAAATTRLAEPGPRAEVIGQLVTRDDPRALTLLLEQLSPDDDLLLQELLGLGAAPEEGWFALLAAVGDTHISRIRRNAMALERLRGTGWMPTHDGSYTLRSLLDEIHRQGRTNLLLADEGLAGASLTPPRDMMSLYQLLELAAHQTRTRLVWDAGCLWLRPQAMPRLPAVRGTPGSHRLDRVDPGATDVEWLLERIAGVLDRPLLIAETESSPRLPERLLREVEVDELLRILYGPSNRQVVWRREAVWVLPPSGAGTGSAVHPHIRGGGAELLLSIHLYRATIGEVAETLRIEAGVDTGIARDDGSLRLTLHGDAIPMGTLLRFLAQLPVS